MANAMQDMILPGNEMTFKVPDRIELVDYPRVIRDFKKHIIQLKKDHVVAERAMDQQRNLLMKTSYKGGGSNKEERDANFSLLLEGDNEFTFLRDQVDALDWAIRGEEAELNKVESDMQNLRLRRREAVIATEIFGGIPVTDSREVF